MHHHRAKPFPYSASAVGIWLCLSAASLPAQTQITPPWTEDSIQSSRLGDVQHLRIALPQGYSARYNASQRYPVVIILAADDEAFAAIVHSTRRLVDPGRVGATATDNRERRAAPADFRHYYPPATGGMARARPAAGGVDTYTSFLASELLPWVGAHFRTLPYTVIAGHSALGHAAVFAYAHAPEAFNAAIAVSPALWWLSDEANDDEVSRDYAARIGKRRTPGRLFVGVGAFDPGNIIKGVDRFTTLVRKDALSFEYRRYPVDSHNSTVPDAFIDGLRWVFQPVSLASNRIWPLLGFSRVDTVALTRAFNETKRRYAEGARSLGFPETLPVSFLDAMAAVPPGPGPRTDALPIARAICEDYVAGYPAFPAAYECLGGALLRQADTAGARRAYAAGLDVARRDAWPNFVRRLDQIIAGIDSAAKR